MPESGVALNGSLVREKRRALLLSQDELAAKVSLHPNTIWMIENQATYRASFKTLKALASQFGCDAQELLRIEEVA